MSRVRGKNTKPELAVRRLVHAMGFRYRLHARTLPGSPDLVFRRRKKVIFVHGCFWHQHPEPACPLSRLPKSRLDFWLPKLKGNQERDQRYRVALEELGWQVLVVWECGMRDVKQLENTLRGFLTQGEKE
jgi:DNA mismatch endonuclease (patch repair protein)